MSPVITLKPGREKSANNRRPWIFSGAIARVDGEPAAGETVKILGENGDFLGWGAYSPDSRISLRVWDWSPETVINPEFFRSRLENAIRARGDMLNSENSACRLVHAESDGLPGLVVDRYSDVLVVQISSAGAEFWRETLFDLLMELTGASAIYERSDLEVRNLEGYVSTFGERRGTVGDGIVQIKENGLTFEVDVINGHKTGFYLDQRRNRQLLRELSGGKRILNCFAYTGGFTINALAGGAAHVLSIDSSAEALAAGERHILLNNLDPARATSVEGDVFKELRTLRDSRNSFDLIILDPPKFAHTRRQADKAARGYKDINLLALKLLEPGGTLVTFSCSGGISADLFQKIVAGAAVDAGLDARIVKRLHAGPDHPVALHFPEGDYLKGFAVKI